MGFLVGSVGYRGVLWCRIELVGLAVVRSMVGSSFVVVVVAAEVVLALVARVLVDCFAAM